MDRTPIKSRSHRSYLTRALRAALLVAVAAVVVQPQPAQAILPCLHKPKASPNPKKLWEKKPPKHKPQKEGLLPLNKWFEHHHKGEGGGGCKNCG